MWSKCIILWQYSSGLGSGLGQQSTEPLIAPRNARCSAYASVTWLASTIYLHRDVLSHTPMQNIFYRLKSSKFSYFAARKFILYSHWGINIFFQITNQIFSKQLAVTTNRSYTNRVHMTRKQHIEYLIYVKVLREDDLNSSSRTGSSNLKAFHKWSHRGFTS